MGNVDCRDVNREVGDIINKFCGNIPSTFKVLRDIYEKFGMTPESVIFYFNSLQRFTNIFRNMLIKNIMNKPIKCGRNLIINENILLQFIVARKYLNAGCSMDSLSGYLINMSNNALYDRLFTKHLPDIEKIVNQT